MGLLGVVFGVILALVAKKFAVTTDPRIEAIIELLPGANCGACGYAGCSGFAAAVVAGEVEPNACLPGGEAVACEIAAVLGREVTAAIKQIAQVRCQGFGAVSGDKVDWSGTETCRAAAQLADGPRACRSGCIGFGDCAAVCPFDAIEMKNGQPIITDSCVGCGVCVRACPKQLIDMKTEGRPVQILCRVADVAKISRAQCQKSCIKCKICLKKCPAEAITWENELPCIDYKKCIDCGLCASVCPRNTIFDKLAPRKKVTISDACIGCTLCKKKCPVAAIDGNLKEQHNIDLEKCIGCYQCIAVCPKNAVSTKTDNQ